jgi:hypothetical protein
MHTLLLPNPDTRDFAVAAKPRRRLAYADTCTCTVVVRGLAASRTTVMQLFGVRQRLVV